LEFTSSTRRASSKAAASARLGKKKREDGKGHAAPDLTVHVEPKDEESQE
jgi:hypothetical protein